MSALTLVQLNQMTQYAVIKKITDSYIRSGSVFAEVPCITDRVDRKAGRRVEGGLGDGGFRALGQTVSSTVITPTSFEETVYYQTKVIDIDVMSEGLTNDIVDPWDFNIKQNIEAMTFGAQFAFINNDPNDSVNGFGKGVPGKADAMVGLKARMTYAKYQQNITQCSLNAAVDLSAGNNTGGNVLNLLVQLDRLYAAMGQKTGKNITLWHNEPVLRSINRGLRSGSTGANLFKTINDPWDRGIMGYLNGRLVDIGRTAPTQNNQQTTYNISNTENADGTDTGTGAYTSIYATLNGANDFMGWTYGAPEISEPYRLPGGTGREVSINHANGLWPQSSLCIGRLYGINVSGV